MSPDREVMTLAEAADFLRLSVSTMHQRKDIPRHRVPGSREYRYLQSELLVWLKGDTLPVAPAAITSPIPSVVGMLDNTGTTVYHRSTQYR